MRRGSLGTAGSAQLQTACRGVRGATTVDQAVDPKQMEAVVGKLLEAMSSPNSVVPEDVAALVFTLQDDLGPINPAAAARSLGYSNVPLLMVREHGGDTRVGRCLRALMLVNTTLSQAQVRHAYLGGAAALRPDLAAGERL
ncbi:MAG: chorismate mutase [Candidatus Dormibacteria bacterium]